MQSATGAPAEGVLRSTLKALAAPRRAIPIAVVVTPLLIIQDAYSADAAAVPLALAMCGAFLLVAPALWRKLFPMGGASSDTPLAARAALYALAGLTLVVGIGRGLPLVIGGRATFLTTFPSLVVCVALFWVGGWGLARDIDLEAHLAEQRARNEALAWEAEHAQILALKSHLDPHFLFNTLNAIAEWCREDGAVAERAILQLSSMLRTMMTAIQETSWPLTKELELVEQLFALHAVRDPSLFSVSRRVPDALPDVDVPPMVLLPIAENAMKHGPLARNKGEIRLSVEVGDVDVTVEIENPGPYAGPREGGSGLEIVRKRMRLSYGDAGSFAMKNVEQNRTVARICLPRSGPSRAALPGAATSRGTLGAS